jgi:hypothetical protein
MATLTQLVTSVSAVIDQFNKAIDAFNIQDKNKVLGGLFDDNVVLVTINLHKPYTGRQPVLNYLKKHQFPVNPQFNPTTVQVVENKVPNVAHIFGTATWGDDDHDKDGSIRYAFNFILDTNGIWVISTLWGSSDS